MYVVGHCVVTEKSGAIAPEEIYGDGLYGLMLPDYVRCHDWGYSKCFDASWYQGSVDRKLIEAHLLGDWFVHYGSNVTERRKEGWAYRNMGVFARRYGDFFKEAARLSLRDEGTPPDSVRGFSHTMVEYSIDTYMVQQGYFETHFNTVKEKLGGLGSRSGAGSREWVNTIIDDTEIAAETPDLDKDLDSFSGRIAASERAEDFAVHAGVKKFGLRPGEDSKALVRRVLLEGLSELKPGELDTFIEDCGNFIAEWIKN